MTPRFDPTRAVVFDFGRGQLRDEEGSARLNLPASLVLRLLESGGPENQRDFGRSLGADLGRRIQGRLGAELERASLDTWVEHLGGHLALLGLGQLQVERWGKALVLRVSDAPLGAWELVGAVLEGALARGASREAELVPFAGEAGIAFVVLTPEAAARARRWSDAGSSFAQVIEKLHQGASA